LWIQIQEGKTDPQIKKKKKFHVLKNNNNSFKNLKQVGIFSTLRAGCTANGAWKSFEKAFKKYPILQF
jgi:hypothetical protein